VSLHSEEVQFGRTRTGLQWHMLRGHGGRLRGRAYSFCGKQIVGTLTTESVFIDLEATASSTPLSVGGEPVCDRCLEEFRRDRRGAKKRAA